MSDSGFGRDSGGGKRRMLPAVTEVVRELARTVSADPAVLFKAARAVVADELARVKQGFESAPLDVLVRRARHQLEMEGVATPVADAEEPKPVSISAPAFKPKEKTDKTDKPETKPPAEGPFPHADTEWEKDLPIQADDAPFRSAILPLPPKARAAREIPPPEKTAVPPLEPAPPQSAKLPVPDRVVAPEGLAVERSSAAPRPKTKVDDLPLFAPAAPSSPLLEPVLAPPPPPPPPEPPAPELELETPALGPPPPVLPRVEFPPLEVSRAESPRVEPPRVEPPRVEPPRVKPSRVETPRFEAPPLEPPRVEPRVTPSHPESPRFEPRRREPPPLEIEPPPEMAPRSSRVDVRPPRFEPPPAAPGAPVIPPVKPTAEITPLSTLVAGEDTEPVEPQMEEFAFKAPEKVPPPRKGGRTGWIVAIAVVLVIAAGLFWAVRTFLSGGVVKTVEVPAPPPTKKRPETAPAPAAPPPGTQAAPAPAAPAPAPPEARAKAAAPVAGAVPKGKAAPLVTPDWSGRPVYVVHFSSHKDRPSAEKEAKRLAKELGKPGRAVEVDLGEKGLWYRVVIGEFATVEEARAYRADLEARKTPGLGFVYEMRGR